MNEQTLPGFAACMVDTGRPYSPEECMRLALDLALQSALNKGGPFGAVITDGSGIIRGIGCNRVVASADSTAHAEIAAIRAAENSLGAFRLDLDHVPGPCTIYCSCEPCIMCYGAIWWSGLKRVMWSAGQEDAYRAGFCEGPVSEELWRRIEKEKGIQCYAGFCRDEASLRPFEVFAQAGRLY